MIELPVETPSGRYLVQVGSGLLEKLGPALDGAGLRGRVAVVADARVLDLHGERALGSLAEPLVLPVPPGEASKSLAEADRLWTALLSAGFSRGDTLVALGGGVVGDLAGFVAATLHRGMAFVQVPTTLLAQVDASVGGKVAIDHPLGKNLIGAFHQPRLVVADVETLQTLPERERWSGLVEIAKAAFLADLELLARLEEGLEAIAAGAPEPTARAVANAVAIKSAIVAADEREAGLRRVLNLGHTVGHALEQATGWDTLRHGEAVLLGLYAAVQVSQRYSGFDPGEARRVLDLLDRFPRPRIECDREAVVRAATRDKKREGSRILFVTLEALAQPVTIPADEALLRYAVDAALEAAK